MAKNIWDDEEPFMDGAPAFENGQWKEPDTYTPAPDNMINAEKIKEARALAAQQPIEEDYDLDELTEQVSQDDDDDDFGDDEELDDEEFDEESEDEEELDDDEVDDEDDDDDEEDDE